MKFSTWFFSSLCSRIFESFDRYPGVDLFKTPMAWQILPVDVAGVVVVVVVEAKFAIFAPDSPAIIELLPDCLQLLRIFIRTAHDQIDGVPREPDID